MSTENDVARSLRSWLRESRHEDADRVLDAVFDQVPATPQRSASWLARRLPIMNNTMRIVIAAAVVVVIAVVGFQFLGGPNTGSPGATETPQPTATPTATPEPSEAAGLPVGSSHILLEDPQRITVTVTIPAPGWYGEVGEGILLKNDGDPPDGAGMIVFTGPLYVYGDACQWSTTQADTPVTTVDELVAALAAQTPRDALEPMDITVDGYSGKEITLHVPDDAAYSADEFTDCDEGKFGSWTVAPGLEPYRYHQGPGQIDEVYILDVDGLLTVIDTSYWAETPTDHVDELRAIVESATFDLP